MFTNSIKYNYLGIRRKNSLNLLKYKFLCFYTQSKDPQIKNSNFIQV